VGIGLLLAGASVMGAALAAAVLWPVAVALRPDLASLPTWKAVPGGGWLTLAAAAGAITSTSATAALCSSRRTALLAGSALLWIVAAWGTALLLPGASYAFTWPLLAGSVALLAPGPDLPRALASGSVSLLVVVPVIDTLGRGMGVDGLPVVAGLSALLAVLLLPLLDRLGRSRFDLPLASAALAVTILACFAR
jgi:hypothetical protein